MVFPSVRAGAKHEAAVVSGDKLLDAMADDRLRMEVLDGSRPNEKMIVLEGVLNSETAFHFRDFAGRQQSGALLIDMSRVRSMDSSGLGVLIGLYVTFDRSCRRLLLAGVNDRIWDLFRMCHIEDVFTRYRTVAEAEQILGGNYGPTVLPG